MRWVSDEEQARTNQVKPLPDVWHVTGTVCDDCGCLLTYATELCPACVIPWCRAQEETHCRLQSERANRAGWYTRERAA